MKTDSMGKKKDSPVKQPFMFLYRCFLLLCWLELAPWYRLVDALCGLLQPFVTFRSLLISKWPSGVASWSLL
jgi:hypothetical protein